MPLIFDPRSFDPSLMPSQEDDDGAQSQHPLRGSGGGTPVAACGASRPCSRLQMEELTLWVIGHAAKFSRTYEFTVGDRLVETCLDITAGLVDASYLHHHSRDKLARLHRVSRDFTRARVLVCLAQRLNYYPRASATFTGRAGEVVMDRMGHLMGSE